MLIDERGVRICPAGETDSNEAKFQPSRIEFGSNVFLDIFRNYGGHLLRVIRAGDVDRNLVVANGCQRDVFSSYVTCFRYRNRLRAVGLLFAGIKRLR